MLGVRYLDNENYYQLTVSLVVCVCTFVFFHAHYSFCNPRNQIYLVIEKVTP